MPIETQEQADRLRSWARDNRSDPRVTQIAAELRTWGQGQGSEPIPEAPAPEPEPEANIDELTGKEVVPAPERSELFQGPIMDDDTRTRAHRMSTLSDRERQSVAQLEEMSRINPSSKMGNDAMIDQIVRKANGTHETLMDQVGTLASVGYGAGVPMIWAAAKEPVAGVAGLFQWARHGFSEDGDIAATNTIDAIRDFGRPEAGLTEKGSEAIQSLGEALAPVEDAVDDIATWGSMGNPYAATAIYTTLMGAPEIFSLAKGTSTLVRGGRGAGRVATPPDGMNGLIPDASGLTRAPDRISMARFVRDHGIPDSGVGWREPVVQAARRIAPESRAADLDVLVTGMRTAKEASETAMNAAFEQARSTRAWIGTRQAADFAQNTDQIIRMRGFDLEQMPQVQRYISQMAQLDETLPSGMSALPGQRFQRVNYGEVEMIRRRINQTLDDTNMTPSEGRAMGVLKNQLDDFIDNEFNQMAINGADPSALAAWQRARGMARTHAENFSDNRAIRQLIELNAEPEQVRNWIMGASDALPPAQVADTVRRIRNVVGDTSPEMVALRAEFTRGLMEPLLKTEPNWNGFMDGVNRFVERNPSLLKEMGFDQTAIPELRKAVTALTESGTDSWLAGLNPYALVSRFTVGHGIAKRGALVRLMTSTLRSMTGAVFGTRRRAVWNEMLRGTPDAQPLFPRNSATAGAFISAAQMDQLGIRVTPEREEQAMDAAQRAVENQQNQANGGPNPQIAARVLPGQGIMATLTGESRDPQMLAQGAEGFRPKPYTNDVVTNPTIGHGLEVATIADRNLNEAIGRSVQDIVQNGVSPDESRAMVSRMIAGNDRRIIARQGETYTKLDQGRRDAIRELAYWAGAEGALDFKDMWRMIKRNDFEGAAREMMDSKTVWGDQPRPTGNDLFRRDLVPQQRKWAFDRMVRIATQLRGS